MWSWLFSGKGKENEEDGLKVLDKFRYCSDKQVFMNNMRLAIEKWPGIHKTFLQKLVSGQVTESTPDFVKEMMNEWSQDLNSVMASLLKSGNVVAAMAMGSEKSKYNKEYYSSVRDEMGMQSDEFRRLLVSLRKEWQTSGKEKTFSSTKSYCLCLHNEPLMFNVSNIPGQDRDIPIVTMYKEKMESYEYIYDPTNLPLETELSQEDVNRFVEYTSGFAKNVPLVIVTGKIGENVVAPENVYLVFTEITNSWGENIFPFFNEKGHSVVKNMMDFLLIKPSNDSQ